jgi:hypothetical protein
MSHRKTNLKSENNKSDEGLGDTGVEGDTLMNTISQVDKENSTVNSVNEAVAKKKRREEKENRDADSFRERFRSRLELIRSNQTRDDIEFMLSLSAEDHARVHRMWNAIALCDARENLGESKWPKRNQQI